MNTRSWLAGFAVLVLGFPATNCLADDSTLEPFLGRAEPIGVLLLTTAVEASRDGDSVSQTRLGPAEPIGRLILVASAIDDDAPETVPTDGFLQAFIVEEAPRLGPPVLLASLIPQELGENTPPHPIHPDKIQDRLRQAAKLLAAAGLLTESVEIQQMVSKIDKEHYERLLLAKREAELKEIQAEVDRLRQSLGHVNGNSECRVTVRIVDIHHTVQGSVVDASQLAASWNQIEEMIKAGKATIASEPSLIVASKQTAQFDSGGDIQESGVAQAGGSNLREFGTNVQIARSEILEGNRIRLTVYAERSMPNPSNSAVIDRSRVQTTLEVTPGQTYVVGSGMNCFQEPGASETVVRGTVFVISADIVPAVLPVSASRRSNDDLKWSAFVAPVK